MAHTESIGALMTVWSAVLTKTWTSFMSPVVRVMREATVRVAMSSADRPWDLE